MLRSNLALPFILIVLSLASAAPARAEDAGVPGAIGTIHAQDLARDIEVLASDAFDGREPGTEGETRTLEYLEGVFRAAGVAPGASDGTYLQAVPLVAVRRAGTPHFRVADARGRLDFTFERDFVTRAGHAVEAAKLARLPVVFAGYGITASEEAWDDFAGTGAGVAGAAVLLLRGEPSPPGDSTRFMGRALTAHALPNEKYENAARHGARAAIVIHTDASAGYPWSVMTGGGLGSAQNFLADGGAATPALELIVHVNEPAARRMLARAELDFDSLYAAAQRPGFRPLATPLKADMDYAANQRAITSHNVIAKVEGSCDPG